MVISLITALMLNFATHYTSSYVSLATSISQTGFPTYDSVYIPLAGHVGTIADSNGDSVWVPINFFTKPTGGYISIGVMNNVASDTTLDSVDVYENKILISKNKIAKTGKTQLYFPYYVTNNSFTSQPELFKFISRWKKVSGKGSKTGRLTLNYFSSQ